MVGVGATRRLLTVPAETASGSRSASTAGRSWPAPTSTAARSCQSGSAYVFDGTGSSWTQLAKLEPADAATGDRFGVAVAISGNVVIGAYLDDSAGGTSGSAYVFSP